MKTIEIFFGISEQEKNEISNILHKHFPNLEIEFRTAQENPFRDEISNYGSIKIKNDEEKFQSFFSEYYQFLKNF